MLILKMQIILWKALSEPMIRVLVKSQFRENILPEGKIKMRFSKDLK